MKKKGNSGVYIIQNTIDQKIYIGASVDMYNRLCQHKWQLRTNKHTNNHLQSSYNKYGEENFIFDVLEECDEKFIYSQENYWCNLLQSHNRKHGYNVDPTAPEGKQAVSNETKFKMSMSAPKRSILAYTIYGDFYKEFSDLYKCAKEFETVAPNIHRKMNHISPKKALIDSKSSRYIFVDKDVDVSSVKEYWTDVFKRIKTCKGKYTVYDCFGKFIGSASSKQLSDILGVTINSISSSVGRNTYLRTLKLEINESSYS